MKYDKREEPDFGMSADKSSIAFIGAGGVEHPIVTAQTSSGGGIELLAEGRRLNVDSQIRLLGRAIPIADFSDVGQLEGMPTGFTKSAVAIGEVDKATAGKLVGTSLEVSAPAGTSNASISTTNEVFGNIAVANRTIYLVMEIVTGYEHLSQIIFYLASDNGLTNHGFSNLVFQRNGFYVIPITFGDDLVGCANDLGQSGTIDWKTIKKFRFNTQFAGGVAAGNVTIRLHSILTHATEAVPNWTMIFDDSNLSDYELVRPLAAQYGLKLGFSVIPELLGSPGYCTKAQLRALYDDGHDILIHGESATDEVGTVAANIARFNSVRDWLISNGMPRGANTIVYVKGTWYATPDVGRRQLLDALHAEGFVSAFRASDTGFARNALETHTTRLTLPRLKINNVNVPNLLRSCDAQLNKVERGGQNIVFMGHRVLNATSGATGEDTYLHSLREIFANVRQRIDARTMRNLSPVELTVI